MKNVYSYLKGPIMIKWIHLIYANNKGIYDLIGQGKFRNYETPRTIYQNIIEQ